MPRLLAVLFASLLLVTACGGGDGGDGADATATPTTAASPGPAATGDSLVQDGVFTGQGLIVPVPEGWRIDRANLQRGIFIAVPGQGQTGALVAADDVLNSPLVRLEGDNFDRLLDQLRAQVDHEPLVDEELDIQGAERAHQLVYDDVRTQGGTSGTPGPPSKQLNILAQSADGQYALFNYVAAQDSYDESLADRVRNEAGLDPDSEPSSQTAAPAPAPTG